MLGRLAAPALVRAFCLWVVIGMPALPAGAQYGGGAGTAENPYLIRTAAHLDAIGATPGDWDKHFKLTADVDLAAYGSSGFHIIGTSDNGPFTGVFDGGHRTISNFRHESDLNGDLGLFGWVDGPECRIENVTLLNPTVASQAGRYVGALVGSLQDGTVSNCHVRAGGVRGWSFVGGLVGRNNGERIDGCTVSATVQGWSRVGGLVGQCYFGAIERCRADGEVCGDLSSYWVGGLIGECRNATVRDCRAACAVQGDFSVGGLVGENYTGEIDGCCAVGVVRGDTNAGGLVGLNSGGTIRDCYARADVKASICVGGLAGCNGPDCHCAVYKPGAIVRCYAVGPVQGETSGGLVGMNDRSRTENSFWDVKTTGCIQSAGGDGRSTLQMGVSATYLAAGWDFVAEKANGTQGLWYMPAAGSYPRLAWELAAWDFNVDGRVDFRDYSRLAAQWRQAGTAGFVGFGDLMCFADLWLAGRR